MRRMPRAQSECVDIYFFARFSTDREHKLHLEPPNFESLMNS